jgi:hypothetical protein
MNRVKRLLAALVMLVQLAVGVVLPASHAAAESAALSHKVHIQAAGDDVCVPHADLACQTCRLLGQQLSPIAGRILFETATADDAALCFAQVFVARSSAAFLPLGSRAPPAL